jgi:lipopolysaccharide biosynthesis glycosyltransferase
MVNIAELYFNLGCLYSELKKIKEKTEEEKILTAVIESMRESWLKKEND